MTIMYLLGQIAYRGTNANGLRSTALMGKWRFVYGMVHGLTALRIERNLQPLFTAIKTLKPLPFMVGFGSASPINGIIGNDVRSGNRLATDCIGCRSQNGRKAT